MMIRGDRYSGRRRGRWPVIFIALALLAGAPLRAAAPVANRATEDAPVFGQPGASLKSSALPGPDAATHAVPSATGDIDADGGGAGCVYQRPGLFSWLRPNCEALRRSFQSPLPRESWLHRPFSAGWFMGIIQGSPLIDDWVSEERGALGGLRLGWDVDNYWGVETRLAFGSVGVRDGPLAIAAQSAAGASRNADLFLWDIDLLYYPWGDAAWRPYLLLGLGTSHVKFSDRLGNNYAPTLLAMPFALGFKYHASGNLALRFEVADNLAFGANGVNTQQGVSFTGGVEVRLGGTRKGYWPWNPSRSYW